MKQPPVLSMLRLRFDFCDPFLNFFHLFLCQRVELHGNQVTEQAEYNQSEETDQADEFQLRAIGSIYSRQSLFKTDHGAHNAYDTRRQRGNQLIYKAEQGSHQARNLFSGTVNFIVGTVSSHGNNDIAGYSHTPLSQNIQHQECEGEEIPAGEACNTRK